MSEKPPVVVVAMGAPVLDLIAEDSQTAENFGKGLLDQGFKLGKQHPHKDEYKKIKQRAIIQDVNFTREQGGTAVNKAITLHNALLAMGRKVTTYHIADTSEADQDTRQIKQALTDAGLTVRPKESLSLDYVLEMAESLNFMIRERGGIRQKISLIKYGDSKENLSAYAVENVFKEAAGNAPAGAERYALVELSMRRKNKEKTFEAYLKEAKKHKFRVIMALETKVEALDDPEERAAYLNLLQQADVIRGNGEELCALFPPDNPEDNRKEQIRNSLEKLQNFMKHNLAEDSRKEAFITLGREGSVVVTPDTIYYTDAVRERKSTIISKTGAGDAATGIFEAYRICDYDIAQATRAANMMGLIVAQDKRSRLPAKEIREITPTLVKRYYEATRGNRQDDNGRGFER